MQWVLSDDVVRAAILAANNDVAVGNAYNIAPYPPVTQVEFVQACAHAAGKGAKLVHVPRKRIQDAGGQLFVPPFYFGVYLDLPPLTVLPDRARSDLGLELTPLDEGLRETFLWYEQQNRPRPDFSWEDELLRAAS